MHRSRTALLIAVSLALVWIALPQTSWAGRGFPGHARSGYATPTGDSDQYTSVVHHRIDIPNQPSYVGNPRLDRRDFAARLKAMFGIARTVLGAYGTIFVEQ